MTNKEARAQIMCVYTRNLDTASEKEQEALNKAMLSLSAWDFIVDAIREHIDALNPRETPQDTGEEAGCMWCLDLIEDYWPVIKRSDGTYE